MNQRTLDERTDADLISMTRSGSPEAFGELYTRYRQVALRIATYYARRDADIDDVVAEAFAKVFAKLRCDRGRPTDILQFRAYLATTIRHQAYETANRQHHRTTTLSGDIVDILDDRQTTTPLEDLAASALSRRQMWQALHSLQPRWQAVLVRVDLLGQPAADARTALDLPTVEAVRKLAQRARAGLRKAYVDLQRNDCSETLMGTSAR